ncbi:MULTISPECIES: hypothetical protein [unclassified Aureispira]|uniref:hypothetical protein n=1 Tax=unclassified Aureispira TaxID=2649989 RepID=UPI0012DBF608|nr:MULTISPECIES: hypothetical protein [unclassified Aureispira]WMX13953.1 hypothetical protein QP953_24160 [Aureispira sp. CCB-E]
MMNQQILIFFIGLSFVLLSLSSCQTEAITYDCTAVAPTYTNHIKSIMDANCAYSGCHDATTKADGINLSNYGAVVSESSRARFMGSMQHEGSYSRMPEGKAQLSTSDLQKIYCWIQNGTPE